MLGLAAVPAVIQFVGFIFMPESPRWLVSKNKVDEAKKVLMKIRGANKSDHLLHETEAELEDIIQAVDEEKRAVGENNNFFRILKRVRN